MDKKTKKNLARLTEELKKALGENLRSVVLYGSSVRGDFVPGKSDVNLMLILFKVDCDSLCKIGRILRKYRSQRFALPVVADWDYLKNSLDVFPMEWEELKRHHQLIYGEDLLSGLNIAREHLRLQLEREFKQNLLWLRELLIEHPDFSHEFQEGLWNACRSISAHLRALCLLAPESEEKDLIARAEDLTKIKLPILKWLLQLRVQGKPARKKELAQKIPAFLGEINQLAKWIDQMGQGAWRSEG